MRATRLPLSQVCLDHRQVALLPGESFALAEIERALQWQFASVQESGGSRFVFIVPVVEGGEVWLREVLASVVTGSYPRVDLVFWDPGNRLSAMVPSMDPRRSSSPLDSPDELWQALGISGAVTVTASFPPEKVLMERVGKEDWIGFLLPGVIPQPGACFALNRIWKDPSVEMGVAGAVRVEEGAEGPAARWLQRFPAGDRYGALGANVFGPVPLLRGRALAVLNEVLDSDPGDPDLGESIPWRLGLGARARGLEVRTTSLLAWVQRRPITLNRQPAEAEVMEAALSRAAGAMGAKVGGWQWGSLAGPGRPPFPMPAPNAAGVAVIMPFRDQPEMTIQTLRSLARQRGCGQWEVILIDNGSTPGNRATVEDALNCLPELGRSELINAPGVFNFATLNQLGVDASAAPWLLFLNNDIELEGEDGVGQLLGLAAWPEVGMVGPALTYPDGSLQSAGMKFGAAGPEVIRSEEDGATAFREVEGMPFAYALCSRRAYEAAGGLDQEVCPNGFGDALFSHRLRAKGFRILAAPWVRAVHHESKSRGRRPEELEWLSMIEAGIPVPQRWESLVSGLRLESRPLDHSDRPIPWSKRLYRAGRAFVKALRTGRP